MIILVLVACEPKAAPTSVPPPEIAVLKAPAREDWEEKWEKLVLAAKKEGKIVVYLTGGGGEKRQAIATGFKKRYGIDMEVMSAKALQLSAKLFSERRAGLYLVDIYMGGTTVMIDKLKPAGIEEPLDEVLLLPEVTSPEVWWEGEFPWFDPEHTIISFLSYVNVPLAINTDLVKPGEIDSYLELLNPKWKGKIVMDDPTTTGTGLNYFTYLTYWGIMGLEHMRELAKQEPKLTRDNRLLVDWLSKGKYPILFAPDPAVLGEFIAARAPVATLTPKEGIRITTGSGNVSLINRAPHPNAAKVFINWLLTKEGVTLYSQATGRQSARVDVSIEHVDPLSVRQPGIKYFKDDIESKRKLPGYIKVAEEIFGHLMK